MLSFIRKSLGRTILSVLALSVALVMCIEIYIRITRGTEDRIKMMTIFGNELAASTYAGIKHPMSVGDSDAVKRQLLGIREKMKGVEVFICDFDHKVIYSTHEDRIKAIVSDFVKNSDALQALNDVSKSGMDSQKSFEEEFDGRRSLITIHPILNQPYCFHCHGSSRKVLGSMVIKMSTEQIYEAITTGRNRSIIITLFGIGVIIILTFAMLSGLVIRPIKVLAEKANKFAEGGMSVSVNIRSKNEVGALANSFNSYKAPLCQETNDPDRK